MLQLVADLETALKWLDTHYIFTKDQVRDLGDWAWRRGRGQAGAVTGAGGGGSES